MVMLLPKKTGNECGRRAKMRSENSGERFEIEVVPADGNDAIACASCI